MKMKVAGAVLALLVAFVPTEAQQPTVANLGWLNGCWERTTRSGRRAHESWAAGKPGELLGSSRVMADSGDRETERLRIYQRGDTLVYHAYPANQPENIFTLRAHSADILVFEDPAHDFPQRIAYRRVGADSLIAIVSNISGSARAIRYDFHRTKAVAPKCW